MNGKFKSGIMFFCIFTLIAILFPPIASRYYAYSYSFEHHYTFLFIWDSQSSLNIAQFVLEVLLIIILSVIFQMNYEKIKNKVNVIRKKRNK